MIRRALGIGTALLLGLGLVTGCGSSNRPRELPLDTVRACDLIPRSEFQRLNIIPEPQAFNTAMGHGTEGSSCLYLLRTGNNVTLNVITNHGIDRWFDSDNEETRFKDVPPIQGYRTIQVWYTYDTATPHHTCRLYVDVADGQSLNIEVGANSQDDPPTCNTARQFAETAMPTLINNH